MRGAAGRLVPPGKSISTAVLLQPSFFRPPLHLSPIAPHLSSSPLPGPELPTLGSRMHLTLPCLTLGPPPREGQASPGGWGKTSPPFPHGLTELSGFYRPGLGFLCVSLDRGLWVNGAPAMHARVCVHPCAYQVPFVGAPGPTLWYHVGVNFGLHL